VGYDPIPFAANPYTHSALRYERTLEAESGTPSIQVGGPTNGWVVNACDGAARARLRGSDVRTPLLLFVAGADAIVHPDGARVFCERLARAAANGCGGPGGGPVVVAQADHELLVERDDIRTPVLRRTLAFFEQHRQR
jgi:lysophospholipase